MLSNLKSVIIAFDGTAASGKGTIARLLAKKLNYDYLDTGLMFRKISYYCIRNMIDCNNEEAILNMIKNIDFDKNIPKNQLHSNLVSDITSQIATKKKVRSMLLNIERNFANNKNGVVMDGRDIGTVVFPNADFKFFFNASLEERANRRYNQLRTEGKGVTVSQVLQYLKTRDERDRTRCVAPLKRAKDSFLIDTTGLEVSEVFCMVFDKVKDKLINK